MTQTLDKNYFTSKSSVLIMSFLAREREREKIELSPYIMLNLNSELSTRLADRIFVKQDNI